MGDERRGGRFRSGVSRLHDLDSVSDTGRARLRFAKSGADSNLRAEHAYLASLRIFFKILSSFFLLPPRYRSIIIIVVLYYISFVEILSIYVVGSFEENFLFLFVPRLVSFVGSIRFDFPRWIISSRSITARTYALLK